MDGPGHEWRHRRAGGTDRSGGIGLSIISALQLRRDNAAFIAAALMAALALLIAFLAA